MKLSDSLLDLAFWVNAVVDVSGIYSLNPEVLPWLCPFSHGMLSSVCVCTRVYMHVCMKMHVSVSNYLVS